MHSANAVAAPSTRPANDDAAYGRKYDASLSTKEIAIRVRADIKTAIKASRLPAGKYSVRIEESSLHAAIRVTAAPVGIVLLRTESWTLDMSGRIECTSRAIDSRTTEANGLLDALETILAAYNYDRSDLASDYHDSNFFSSVGFDYEWEKGERDVLRAILADA